MPEEMKAQFQRICDKFSKLPPEKQEAVALLAHSMALKTAPEAAGRKPTRTKIF